LVGIIGVVGDKEIEVDPKVVHGSEAKILEITRLERNRGFGLNNVNLPNNWDRSIGILRRIVRERFIKDSSEICRRWNFSLEETVFDPNNIIKEIVINDSRKGSISRMFLGEMVRKKGVYLSENLMTIESVMIFQRIMGSYLNFGWGENFYYGYILGDPETGLCFNPWCLRIPEKIIKFDGEITNEFYQQKFRSRAANIAKKFDLDLGEELLFNKKGLLRSVSIYGDRSYFSLENDGLYCSHNVDTPNQAVALHTIVASFINEI